MGATAVRLPGPAGRMVAMRLFDRSRPPRAVLRALGEVSAWAFDWDGTLLDSIGRIRATYREVFREFEIPWSDAAFDRHYTPNWHHLYERLGVARERWLDIDRRWVQVYETEVSGLLGGAAEALAWLRERGARMALVTAGHRSRVELELRVNGLQGVFETAVYGNEVPHQKPDPAPLILASRYLRVKPEALVLVGDAAEDMMMARRAGSLPVGVLSGAGTKAKLRGGGARWVVRDVPALVAHLQG
jgi:HAD superfamily hydrolase (TIGR01549 family)